MADNFDLMSRNMAANNFVSGHEQMSVDPRPANDFTNFFTQDPSGGGYNDDGAKSDQQDFSKSLEDYSAPHAPPLMEYPIGYQGPSGFEANSNSYGTPSNNYGAPSDGYDSPSIGYNAPSNSYGAPSNSYSAPSNSYDAPSSGYGPPSNSYGEPSNSYEQPSSYDVPLTDQSLTPHDGSYNSPSHSYDSPRGQDPYGDYSYDAPSTGHGYSGQSASYNSPHHGYPPHQPGAVIPSWVFTKALPAFAAMWGLAFLLPTTVTVPVRRRKRRSLEEGILSQDSLMEKLS